MTRRFKPPRKKPEGGGTGVLMGMRSGVQKVAGAVAGGDKDDSSSPARKTPMSKVWSLIANIVSGILIVAAIAMFLRRCGIVHF